MKLFLTPQAISDLNQIGDYIRERNPQAALRVRDSIETSLKLLELFPYAGREQTGGIRRLITRKYAYLAYYRVDESNDEVVVVTIQHPARRRAYQDV